MNGLSMAARLPRPFAPPIFMSGLFSAGLVNVSYCLTHASPFVKDTRGQCYKILTKKTSFIEVVQFRFCQDRIVFFIKYQYSRKE
jgi:hypothetical protein